MAAFLDRTGAVPVAIPPLAELRAVPTPQETAWMARLAGAAPRVAVDTVRSWNRLPALCADAGEVLCVQLVRDPTSWVTAHLRPSGRGTWRKRVMDVWRRAGFFVRRGGYDNYHYETIVTAALAQDHPMWRAVALPVPALARAPAHVKLLAFWWAANLATYGALRAAGRPAPIVTLSEFSQAPRAQVGRILAAAGWDDLDPDLSHVTATRAAHGTGHRNWDRAARALDIPPALLAPGGAGAAALEAAFAAALARGGGPR